MDDLDSNLREGMETDLLYREFLKTIPKDYLEIENVSMRSDHEAVEVCVCVCVCIRACTCMCGIRDSLIPALFVSPSIPQ